jgi:hypothetical protein
VLRLRRRYVFTSAWRSVAEPVAVSFVVSVVAVLLAPSFGCTDVKHAADDDIAQAHHSIA